MKATLEFDLPEEQEELLAATQGLEWKRCLEDVVERIVAWKCGKPIDFTGRELEAPIQEMEPVLDYIHEQMVQRGLRFDE